MPPGQLEFCLSLLGGPQIRAEHLVTDVMGRHAPLHQFGANVAHEIERPAGERVDVIGQGDVGQVHVALAGAGVAGIDMVVPGIGGEVVKLMPHALDRLAKRMILSGTVGVCFDHRAPWLCPHYVLNNRQHGRNAGAGARQE